MVLYSATKLHFNFFSDTNPDTNTRSSTIDARLVTSTVCGSWTNLCFNWIRLKDNCLDVVPCYKDTPFLTLLELEVLSPNVLKIKKLKRPGKNSYVVYEWRKAKVK